MNPAHETGVHIAGGVRQDIVHEFPMNGGQVRGRLGKIAAKPGAHLVWNRLPDRTFTDVLDVIENVVEHAVRLGPKGRPIGRVERRAGVLLVHGECQFNYARAVRPRFMIGRGMPPLPDALSFCMIVKNEERNLPRCLDSVRDLAGELIVVDTGSADQTRRIATSYGAQVIPFDFTAVDFAAARNRAIARASGRWILVLDADETLDRASVPIVESLVALGENAGYFLERHNHSSDSSSPTTDYVVRLFPNRPNYRYRGRVHETIDAAILSGGGRLRKTEIRIDHNFASDRESRRRKNHWYIEILKEEIAADPSDDSRLDFLAAEYHQLEMFDEATGIAERIVRMRPRDAQAHLFLGTYHLVYQNDLVRARADFNQALKLRPDYAEAKSFLQLIDERERA